MSAQNILVAPVIFPPSPDSTDSSLQLVQAPTNLSYIFTSSGNIRTISTKGATSGNDVQGLLYTPDITDNAACVNASDPYVPSNATRRDNIPENAGGLVALAPWLSPSCVLAYLSAARQQPTQGFLFFLPVNNSDTPPLPNDLVWNLGDFGQWKADYDFPVYAVPGEMGQTLLHFSALYSGNLTSVPFGHDISEMTQFDTSDYVRLYVELGTGSGSSLPSLWVFLLIVLAVLLVVIGLTSVAMHWLQRRRRAQLRRRVERGEVDLEALGIKRLTVPQEVLDEMPLYTYKNQGVVSTATSTGKDGVTQEKVVNVQERPGSPSPTSPSKRAQRRGDSFNRSTMDQPTCAICLEDYVAATGDAPGTTVRELPCQHIFHPECVDAFLRDNSSLCPLCKTTALPKGYCPRVITNAMVRRERLLRTLRDRLGDESAARMAARLQQAPIIDAWGHTRTSPLEDGLPRSWRSRTASSFSALMRSGGRPPISFVAAQPMVDLRPVQPLSSTQGTISPPTPVASATNPTQQSHERPQQVQPPSTPGRREWARQRALSMVGRQAPTDPDAEEARTTSRWKKMLRGAFPALGR